MDLLDNPMITSALFYPRSSPAGDYPPLDRQQAGIFDGTIPVRGDVVLGYRLYLHRETSSPLLLFFHGNGEIASDYDGVAPAYQNAGVSMLVVDYRGYGWSTGRPLVSTLLRDTEAVCNALPTILQTHGIGNVPLFVKGRSLGSAPAIHAAYAFPDRFKGLIVESGFADIPSILMRLGISLASLARLTDAPVANAKKLSEVHLPLLVIHGERDTLLPVENGQKLYDASPSQHKSFLRIPGAGHNDLLLYADTYFNAVKQFFAQALSA